MTLNDKWSISYDENNVMLNFKETRTREDKEKGFVEYESTETFYYPNLKMALNAFIQKEINYSESIDDVLKRINELEVLIELKLS